MYKLNCCVAVAVVGLGGKAVADIINVPGDQPTIQAGIDAAANGDEVVVAPGTYFETINFLGKAITLRSSDGPEVTIIDATGLNDSVVKCISGEQSATVLDGFTITGGVANFGGGMSNVSSSPTVTNCTFSGNSGGFFGTGGGMFNQSSSPTVTNCTFSGNLTINGGGMRNFQSSPVITNCTFCANSPQHINGQVVLFGQIHMSTFCPIPVCPGDIDGDGTVAVPDLLTMLAAWGPCP